MRCNVRNRLKFGKITTQDLFVYENVKNGYREFDHRGTLTLIINHQSHQKNAVMSYNIKKCIWDLTKSIFLNSIHQDPLLWYKKCIWDLTKRISISLNSIHRDPLLWELKDACYVNAPSSHVKHSTKILEMRIKNDLEFKIK